MDKTVQPSQKDGGPYASLAGERGVALAKDEEDILRCLGAAVIMQWNTLPKELQKELFDKASSKGDLPQTAALRDSSPVSCTNTKMTKRSPALNAFERPGRALGRDLAATSSIHVPHRSHPSMRDVDASEIQFQCPNCGHDLTQSIGRLKASEHMTCPGCSIEINTDTVRLAKATEEIQKAMSKTPSEITIKFFH